MVSQVGQALPANKQPSGKIKHYKCHTYPQHRVCGTKWWAMPTLPGFFNVFILLFETQIQKLQKRLIIVMPYNLS
mgnify:CR=1 FL=1